MRIGHYAPNLSAKGGISTYVRRLGAAQEMRGHNVVFFSRSTGRQDDDIGVADDASLFRQAGDLNLDVLHLHKSLDQQPPTSVPVLRTMHGHQGSCPSASRYLARQKQPCHRVPNLPGCVWGHLIDRCGSARPSTIASDFARLTHEIEFAGAVRTLTVSDYLRNRMVEAGCSASRIRTLHSPAPSVATPAGPVDRSLPPRFLFLGRLVPQKGLMWLLRAFAAIPMKVHLDVAGEGPLLAPARTFVRKSGLANRVTFHGWVEGGDVPELMAEARAVVFPSIWQEPAGLVSLEAAAHGRALIASCVGGIPEYVSNASALLVPPNDVSALTTAMESLSRDPDRASRMGRAGRQLVTRDFAMDRFVDRLDTVYNSVIGVPED